MNMKSIRLRAHEVQGILDGRQTQTRRIVKAQIDHECWVGTENGPVPSLPDWSKVGIAEGKLWCGNCGWLALNPLGCPYGKTGDVLYVRETWAVTCGGKYEYKADGGSPPRIIHESANESGGEDVVTERWFPSIHMPKEACRLFLRITDIRVERLQDITEMDARAEGVKSKIYDGCGVYECYATGEWQMSAKSSFATLWQSINGQESWQANPWVWCVSFERIDKPEKSPS